MTGAAVSVRGLGKSFGAREVLTSVELEVPRGQLLGLVGPNGAGKSTLLRTLLGLVPPTSGSVRVLGLDPVREALAVRRRTSYLPGEAGVYLQMTGAQFLRFAASFHPQQPQLRDRLLDGFALPLRQRVRSYSAGMKQKLALAAALLPDVELYVLDEPDRALDASVRFFVRDVLRDLRASGRTIVLSSHHLGEVESLADRLEFLLDGRFVAPARLRAARERLRQCPRVRLAAGRDLPPGARRLRTEPGGTLVVETEGDPMAWLRAAPDGAIESAEVGIPRLEDLYELLLHEGSARGGAA